MAKIEDLSHNLGYSRTSIIGTRGTGRNRPDNMNINEEQKLIILRERHLIVKQNIHKSFLKKYGLHFHFPLRIPPQVCINNKISEKCFYIGLKCQSKPVYLKEEHRVRIDRESHHSSKQHDLDSVNIVLSFHS